MTMKNLLQAAGCYGLLALALSFPALADEPPAAVNPASDATLIDTAKASIQRGVNYLTGRQAEDGSWCRHPGITGLICMALHNSQSTQNVEVREAAVEKGRQFILKHVQPDGSIWLAGHEREYPTYTTAIALAALAIINHPDDEPVMRGARKYLLGSQLDENNLAHPTQPDSPLYGGIGYGGNGPAHADLSNTQWALEALYLTDYLDQEPKAASPEDAKRSELAWAKAVQFMSRLQHLPESNDQTWVVADSSDPNYGGFVYRPDDSKSGQARPDGLRSYGSMTYAGLKSMIYAKLPKDDPRVKAATEWARKNYTVDENPGMGQEGLYYYLVAFAKAHAAAGTDKVVAEDGREFLWRNDLLKKMISLQKDKGEWCNEGHGRWMEVIPELVTAYSLLSMELALAPAAP
jgi:squalene-hopene/tetraprenyl-beta-curcumene cyclase